MSLFDDDFYSPKLSPWKRRKLAKESRVVVRTPMYRGFRWRISSRVLGLTACLGLLLLVFIAVLWGGGGADRQHAGMPAAQEAFAGGELSAADSLRQIVPTLVADIVEQMKPAVVSVINKQMIARNGGEPAEEEVGSGSGIIYRLEGNKARVVTNHHVIDGASDIDVILYNGKRLDTRLIGSDVLSDLAVLEIDARDVEVIATFGDSDHLREGEWVVAIGHPFGLGYSPSSTWGIISSLQRTIPISLAMNGQIDWEMNVLQTDAAINRGNSGGALLDMNGRVIGINSMKVSQFGVEGLGFAIPSNTAVRIIEELETYGKVRRPYLGVATVDLHVYQMAEDAESTLGLPADVKEGIIVLEAFDPSAAAGIRTNDVIVALDGVPIDGTLALRKYLYNHKKIGEPIRIDYYRGDKKDSVTVTLAESPDPE